CPLPFAVNTCGAFPSAFLLRKSGSGFATIFPFAASFPTPFAKPFIIPVFIFNHHSPNIAVMDAKKLALLCRELADNRKAEDILVLDVRKISSVTDYFVIASGTSEPHLRALSDEILNGLREEHRVRPKSVDGTLQGGWLVVDLFDVIVHIMRQDVRERYDLAGLWGAAVRVKMRRKALPA